MTPEQEAKVDRLLEKLEVLTTLGDRQLEQAKLISDATATLEVLTRQQGIQQESLKSAWDAINRAVDRRRELQDDIREVKELAGNAFDTSKAIAEHLGVPMTIANKNGEQVSTG